MVLLLASLGGSGCCTGGALHEALGVGSIAGTRLCEVLGCSLAACKVACGDAVSHAGMRSFGGSGGACELLAVAW